MLEYSKARRAFYKKIFHRLIILQVSTIPGLPYSVMQVLVFFSLIASLDSDWTARQPYIPDTGSMYRLFKQCESDPGGHIAHLPLRKRPSVCVFTAKVQHHAVTL
jgi:hypothetical protein